MPRHPADGTCAQRVIDLWPKVLQIIREYDEAFPYAQKDGDDETVTLFDQTVKELEKIA